MTINKDMSRMALPRLLQCACFLSLGLWMVDVTVVEVVSASSATATASRTTPSHHSNLRRHASTTTSSTETEMMVEVLVKLKPTTATSGGGFLVTQSVQQQQQQQSEQENDHGFFSAQAIHSLSQRHAGKLHVHEAFAQVSLLTATVPVSSLADLEHDESVAFVEPNGLVYQQGREHAPYGIAMTLGTSKTSQMFYSNNIVLPQQSLSYIHGQQQQQQDDEGTTSTTAATSGTLSRDSCPMIIGIVDGGLDVGHYDFEYCGVMDTNGQADPTRASSSNPQKCIGKAFLESTDMTMGSDWYNPTDIHGSHVAGVIGASARNGAGIRGMLSDEQLCLVLSRIFTSDGSSSVSKVVEAMLWTIEQGVKVLNLSLGTEIEYQSIKETVDYAEQQGILLIASAGNGAEFDPPILTNYPADYDNVLSVAAVDEFKKWVMFSNHNAHVNLAAPGSNIHSTIPRKSREAATLIKPDRESVFMSSTTSARGGVDTNSGYTETEEGVEDDETAAGTENATVGTLMEYSRYVGSPGVNGVLVDCQYGADVSDCILPTSATDEKETYPNTTVNGTNADDIFTKTSYICMLQRGGNVTFFDKISVCISNGGVGAIVFNNQNGEFQGSMGTDENSVPQRVNIPVAGIDLASGIALLDQYRGQRITLENPLETKNAAGEFVSGGGYGYLSGTSMAAPHVAGAAGLIWRACPSCTRDDVWGCLESTAEDLGDEGRDDYFGKGLVQADFAFQCLLESDCCQQGVDQAGATDPIVSAAASTHSAADSPLILV